jgi:pyruvate ferredoxin oxidoreductase beta subunit/2-oxoisovalerate ferredoxin oxidoreductase beta subunit
MSQITISLPEDELMSPGHVGCQGCGAALAMRYVLKALGEKTIAVIPACCWSIIAGPFPHTALKIPVLHAAFASGAVTASGVRAALDTQGDQEITVLVWAGDGGTFDIGIQSLSGAAERNENILYVCYDNEAYMNTGIQRSSATPFGAWTTTTPTQAPKLEPKKDIIAIMAAHRIPYAATATVAYPDDLCKKIQKAKEIRGMRFIQILAPCPPGWKASSELAVTLARLAVKTKLFPLYEVEHGAHYTLNLIPEERPVREYLERQGRFNHLSDAAIQEIQIAINLKWETLQRRANNGV